MSCLVRAWTEVGNYAAFRVAVKKTNEHEGRLRNGRKRVEDRNVFRESPEYPNYFVVNATAPFVTVPIGPVRYSTRARYSPIRKSTTIRNVWSRTADGDNSV